MPTKIYLAIPYSWNHETSFRAANKITARLIDEGNIVYSPISLSHPVQDYMTKANTFETWMVQDLEFVNWCDELHVVVIGEFGAELIEQSRGVQAELSAARDYNKPIKTINYYD
jgi:hypothetical protein